MLRYVALCWDESNPRATEVASRLSSHLLHTSSLAWHTALKTGGTRVFTIDEDARSHTSTLLSQNSGVCIGTLFNRQVNERNFHSRASFDRRMTREVLSSAGGALVQHYWGNYVAFLCDAETRRTHIIRGPMSSMPCFLYEHGEVCVCFSDLWDFIDLCSPPLSINWKYVAAAMKYQYLYSRETGLEGVSQLRAGERYTREPQGSSSAFLWNPLAVATSDMLEDPEVVVRQLRTTVQNCSNAWAADHECLLHHLSGGIDSSIVVSCLARSPTGTKVVGLNYYSDGCNTDERKYARAAAARAGVRLAEVQRRSFSRFDPLLTLRVRCPNPTFYIGYVENSEAERDLAALHGASAFTGGVGGDQLFFQSRTDLAIGDYVRRHGLNSGALRIAHSAAVIEQMSIWAALKRGLRDALSRSFFDPLAGFEMARRFLSESGYADGDLREMRAHPCLRDSADGPWGKRWHAWSMTKLPFMYDPIVPDNRPHLYPLFSQPIVELCLRSPTYVLTRNTWDRWAARQAFSAEVPSEIIWRRTKGGMEEHARALVIGNLDVIRELLLDGVLARQGLVNLERLHSYLTLKPSAQDGGTVELFEYLSIEAWLRSVSRMNVRAAAA